MASAKAIARQQARRYFSRPRDRRIFLRQMGAEAGFQDLTSPKGAGGYAQIMPGTARSWGVKNVHDPREAYGAAAKAMRKYLDAYHGSWEKALAAYNAGTGAVAKYGGVPPFPETKSYIRKILGGGDVKAGGGGGGGDVQLPDRLVTEEQKTFDAGAFKQARGLALLGSMIARRKGTDSPLFKTGILSTEAPAPGDFLKTVLKTRTIEGGTVEGGGGGGSAPAPRGGGNVVGRPLDRAGVKTNPKVIELVRRASAWGGMPIALGTGSQHSKMTANGNVSDHWGGNALDLPATGTKGDRIAGALLVQLGVPRKKARQMARGGGIHNINYHGHRYQVIWRAPDHYDHVHVGRS